MNKQEADVLKMLVNESFVSQREIAERTGHSLGVVNRSIKTLVEKDYLNKNIQATESARKIITEKSPRRAVILAAGFGMRMVPINTETPKAFVEVHGEALIERLIKQLHEVEISDISVVVGFMKERFDYLIDEYGVELIVNREYSVKNNLHSVELAKDNLKNCYIVPCDIWCENNPFDTKELYSWYMVNDTLSEDSSVRVNRKNQLSIVSDSTCGNTMIGICYLTGEESLYVCKRIEEMSGDRRWDNAFWEEALYSDNQMIVNAKIVDSTKVFEINTYEQLRDLDDNSDQLKSDAITVIAETLDVMPNEINNITVLKKGMTNRSFLFSCNGQEYIMRIPGEGTDQLINRREEASVYQTINGLGISDDLVYINPKNGYKITKYLANARVCDSRLDDDLKKCMLKLRDFHNMNLKVDHTFNIYEKIDFYESLWNGQPSEYKDYDQTKRKVFELKSYIDTEVDSARDYRLTHIDAVPDNFLIAADNQGEEQIRLIDWEYAAMQDSDVDIAMFCIYALYDRNEIDHLIDIYYEGECSKSRRIKIYCYIAACGLLWSNWCEYKRNFGVEFGEYSMRQYRYAKDFYRIVKEGV